jgi:AraC-like DNA-binding protein
MNLSTTGKNYYPDYIHPLWIDSDDDCRFNEGLYERYRLILLLEGTGICEISGRPYPIMSPAFYCLNEQESISLYTGSYMRAKSLYFHPNLINDQFKLMMDPEEVSALTVRDHQDLWYLEPFRNRLLNDNHLDPIIISADPSLTKHAAHLFEEIHGQLTDQLDSHWPCRSRSALIELLTLLRRPLGAMKPTVQPIPGSAMDPIQPVILYLHTNYKLKIKIDDLTKLFHTNKTTLNQQFKISTGLSIMSYLNAIRMQMASFMLRNTQLPTEEIKHRVGLRDNAHFSRTFRKHSGCSPAEFRNL